MSSICQKYKQIFLEGKKDEAIVEEVTAKTFNCQTKNATRIEDMTMHVDFWCIVNGKQYGVDVKGVRKNNRTDSYKDDTINWIEIQNVNGDKGWLYGRAVYIAFMTNTSILYVPTANLRDFIEKKIKGKELTYIRPNDFYIPYQRKGRKDIITKVPTSDLRLISKHEVNL